MRENQHLGDVFDAHTDAEFKTRDIETGAEQDARLIDPDLSSNTADPKRLAGTPYGRLGVLVLVLAVFVASLPAVIERWRRARHGFIKALWMFGVYLLYVALRD